MKKVSNLESFYHVGCIIILEWLKTCKECEKMNKPDGLGRFTKMYIRNVVCEVKALLVHIES